MVDSTVDLVDLLNYLNYFMSLLCDLLLRSTLGGSTETTKTLVQEAFT